MNTEGVVKNSGVINKLGRRSLRIRLLKRPIFNCCRVDMVLVGAEGVVENGGVINKLGTYQLALCARAHNIPFYVAAESYKVHVRVAAWSRAWHVCGASPSLHAGITAIRTVGPFDV